jgi:hypothetical protein
MSAIASAFKTMALVRAAAPKPAAARQFARAPSALVAIAPNRHRAFRASVAAKAAYGKDEKGDYPSLDYRIFFKDGEKAISPWHDVPLYNADGTCNFICEIPKETKVRPRSRGARRSLRTRNLKAYVSPLKHPSVASIPPTYLDACLSTPPDAFDERHPPRRRLSPDATTPRRRWRSRRTSR